MNCVPRKGNLVGFTEEGFSCDEFKHEKHIIATWELGNHLSSMYLRNVSKFLPGDTASHSKKVSNAVGVQLGAARTPVGPHGTSHCVLIIHRGASPLGAQIRAQQSCEPHTYIIFRLYSKYVNLVCQASTASLHTISNPLYSFWSLASSRRP